MAKDGEASVEDILRSIKQVISREDGPRRSPDTFARDAARENGQPVPERPSSYAFRRHSPFGARQPESALPAEPPLDDRPEDSRTDVFDLRSLDSEAFEVDDEDKGSAATGEAPIVLPPPGSEAVAEQRADKAQSSDHDYGAQAPNGEEPRAAMNEVSSSGEVSAMTAVEEPLELDEPVAEPAAEAKLAPGTSEGLIAGAAADALRDRFSALQQAASAPASQPTVGNPLEEVVRDMLRPMLKQWLDEHMPGLVEKIVEREIARITGRL